MSASALKSAATGQPARDVDPYTFLKNQLERSKGEFLPLLGGNMDNVDKFVRVVLNAVMATPELLDVDRRSLLNACMRAGQDGLLPDGREAVLNVYSVKVKARGNQQEHWVKMAQYLPMVGGIVKKLYASPDVASVDAAAVYENDKFLFRRGDDPKLEHEPTMSDKPGKIIAAYCVVKLTNGEIKREVMPRRDIEAVRSVSKAGDGPSAPWTKWYDQQAIKSVIKRIYKQLPKSDDFERTEAADNQALGYVSDPSESMTALPSQQQNAPNGNAPALENQPSDVLGEIDQTSGELLEREDASPVANKQQAADKSADRPADQQKKYRTYADVAHQITKAATPEQFDLIRGLIADLESDGQKAELIVLANQRLAAINPDAL